MQEERRNDETNHAFRSGFDPPVFPAVPMEQSFRALPVKMSSSVTSSSSNPLDDFVNFALTVEASIATVNVDASKPRDSDSSKHEQLKGDTVAMLSPKGDAIINFQSHLTHGVEVQHETLPSIDEKSRRSSSDYLEKCKELFAVMDDMDGLRVIVLALPDDMQALALLESIQEHLSSRPLVHCIRYIVLMKDVRWAEAFTLLDAIALHEFVSSTRVALVASITPDDAAFTLVPPCSDAGAVSDAFLEFCDGALLSQCCPSSSGYATSPLSVCLSDRLSDRASKEWAHGEDQIDSKLMNILRERMQVRKIKASGGRMLRAIEDFITRNLPVSAATPLLMPINAVRSLASTPPVTPGLRPRAIQVSALSPLQELDVPTGAEEKA